MRMRVGNGGRRSTEKRMRRGKGGK